MQFGSYTVERSLEQHGPLTVYIARHATTGEPVLLTVFESQSPDQAIRWSERLNALEWLRHPGIVAFSERGEIAHAQYVVTPLATPVLGRNRILSPAAALDVSRQISPALDYAHRQGVVHGLLRPAHVVKVDEDRYALRGFELALDPPRIPSADMVALGQFFHRALVGKPIEDQALSPRLPTPIADVLRKTLLGSKGFESAGAFHAAFSQAVAALPAEQRSRPLVGSAATHDPVGERAAPRIHPLIFVLFIVAFAVAAGAVYLFLNQRGVSSALLPTQAALPQATDTPLSVHSIAPTATLPFTLTPTSNPAATWTPAPTNTDPPPDTPTVSGAITATSMVISTDTETPIPTDTAEAPTAETSTPTAIPLPAKPCISLVGDSVTHGGVTYEIPDTGYIIGLTHPLADFVNQELRNEGINTLVAYDRGVSNTGINTPNHPSYFNSPTYGELLRDHCKYTVIMPWFNDITPGKIPQADAAPGHVRAIIALARNLSEKNPDGRIILLNYYQGAVAAFAASTWARGFTPENRDLYNREIQKSCDFGSISTIPQVVCINSDDAFRGMGNGYVIGMISREELNSNLVAPLGELQQSWLDQYYAGNPGALLQGDGIHLSTVGKQALSAFIVKLTQTMPEVPTSEEDVQVGPTTTPQPG